MNTSDPTPNDAPKPPEGFEEFTFVREEIRFQHDLLGHRIGSYLTAQSFLATALAISAVGASSGALHQVFTFVVLPGLGIVTSWLIGIAIYAACDRIGLERTVTARTDRWKHLLPDRVDGNLSHDQSLRYARSMPWIVGSFWALASSLLGLAGVLGW